MAGSPDGKYNGLQNGIQALAAPQDALIGVFLTGAEPDTVTPPSAGLDHSTSASRAEHSYRDLQNQQPFYIGQGSANSTSQSFVVPKGAIRLYLGVFDGWQTTTTPARCR